MTSPEQPDGSDIEEPANLRFLRRLVTVLTTVMIGGVLLIIALIVIRFYDAPPPLPDRLTLPDGVSVISFTQGPDWYAVVTSDDRILIYDRVTGKMEKSIVLD